MFAEEELRLLRKSMTDLGYIRYPTTEEEELIAKLTRLINELHFIKKRDDERSKTRTWRPNDIMEGEGP